jgi:hypothetical protein
MRTRRWTCLMAVGLSLGACADLTDTHRWASMKTAKGDDSEVQVRFCAAPVPSSGDQNALRFTAFSNEGQAAFIRTMDAKTRSPAEFRKELAAPLSTSTSGEREQIVVDRSERLLIATLSRPSDYSPGDRIMRAVITVQPRNFTFDGYTVAQTDRQTIDIATLNRTSTRGLHPPWRRE